MIYKNRSLEGMENEIWNPVSGYPDYMVSNMGRVKSLSRKVKCGYGSFRVTSEVVLNQIITIRGYCTITAYLNGVPKILFVHKEVAKAFIPNPLNKETVNHIFGIKTDNRATQLEWNTIQENIAHSFRTGLKPIIKGAAHYKSRIVIDTASGVFYYSLKEAAYYNNINYSTLKDIMAGVVKNKTNLIYA